jgi:hypothetical protein
MIETILLGILSSLIASLIFIKLTKLSFRLYRSFPKGVRFISPNRDVYLKMIANLISQNEQTFFFKCITGYDLFSSEIIKESFDNKRMDCWKELFFVFTHPKSRAFQTEPNPLYTPGKLERFQQTVLDYIQDRLFENLPNSGNPQRGIYFIDEDKNLFNLLILDTEAFVFFRGFTQEKGAKGQIIINVNLTKCPVLVKELIEFVKNYYLKNYRQQLK